MVVKSVGVLSVGKMFACLYGLLGLIIGGLFSVFAMAGAAVGGRDAGPAALLFGVGAVIMVPIFYGAIGFIGGIIMAALYNIVAGIAGGIEIELQQTPDDRWRERSTEMNIRAERE
jgi:hypothetical protein